MLSVLYTGYLLFMGLLLGRWDSQWKSSEWIHILLMFNEGQASVDLIQKKFTSQ